VYDATAPFVWNSHAAAFIFGSQQSARTVAGVHELFLVALMKDYSQRDNKSESPYSPLIRILLLLIVGAEIQIKAHGIWF